MHMEISADVTREMIGSVILRYRSNVDQIEYRFDAACEKHGNGAALSLDVPLDQIEFKGVFWDVFLCIKDGDEVTEIQPVCTGKLRRKLKIKNICYRTSDDWVLYPRTTRGGKANLLFKKRDHDENAMLRLKEFAALAIYKFSKPFWKKKKIWLIYEKFCHRAQDNSYYFFRYCMDDARRENVYYVIDKNCEDYRNVKQYGRNVVSYLSLRHILYLLASEVYIAAESSLHAYVWHSRPSMITDRVIRHKIISLRHGVVAMKNIDRWYSKQGSAPATRLICCSDAEKDIFVKNWGYEPEIIEVTGLARWDVLEDRSDSSRPVIFIMPTWREWLNGISDEQFAESDFYKRYDSLVNAKELHEIAEKYNAVIKLYFHPKMQEHIRLLETGSDRIQFVDTSKEQINEVMMDCSMLITDYSSVAWDVAYMRKKIVFYQFDQELYIETAGSYIDFNTELPGEVCMEEDELLCAVRKAAENGFAANESELRSAEKRIKYRDNENCRRIYVFLVGQGF